jgi:hypothetical protein
MRCILLRTTFRRLDFTLSKDKRLCSDGHNRNSYSLCIDWAEKSRLFAWGWRYSGLRNVVIHKDRGIELRVAANCVASIHAVDTSCGYTYVPKTALRTIQCLFVSCFIAVYCSKDYGERACYFSNIVMLVTLMESL